MKASGKAVVFHKDPYGLFVPQQFLQVLLRNVGATASCINAPAHLLTGLKSLTAFLVAGCAVLSLQDWALNPTSF